MTLVVGVKYPCGPLRNLNIPQAVILVTDTRWTRYYPISNKTEYVDIAMKLFTFPDLNAIVAYAGDVQSGEHCINEFMDQLDKNKKKNLQTSLYLAHKVFMRAYKYHVKRSTKKVFDLFILLGVCDNVGISRLIYFSSPNFKPIFLEGIKCIGIEEACKEVEDRINQDLCKPGNVKLQEDPEHFGMYVAGVMNDLIVRIGKYNGIGGLIQLAILTKDEVIQPSLYYTKDPTGKTDIWHKATALPNEVTTYQDEYKLGPDYINPKSFKLYSISDK